MSEDGYHVPLQKDSIRLNKNSNEELQKNKNKKYQNTIEKQFSLDEKEEKQGKCASKNGFLLPRVGKKMNEKGRKTPITRTKSRV